MSPDGNTKTSVPNQIFSNFWSGISRERNPVAAITIDQILANYRGSLTRHKNVFPITKREILALVAFIDSAQMCLFYED